MIKLPACEPIGAYDSLSHEEWIQLRTSGIGGSDAGAIMGMSKYSSNLSIWMDKTGRSKPDDLSDNEAVQVGNILEPLIRDHILPEYLEEQGHSAEIIAPTHMYRSIENSFMIINVDGFLVIPFETDEGGYIVVDDKLVGLEIKTGNSYVLSQWGGKDGNEIPDSYYCQVQHYMAGTGLDEFWVFGLIGNNRLLRIVPRNNDFIARLIEAERDLWEKVVLNDVLFAPMPSGSDSDMEALFTLGSPQVDSTVDLSEIDVDMVNYVYFGEQIGILEKAKEETKQKIIATLGISKYGEGVRHKATFSRFDRSSFDKGKFEKDHPGMMEPYVNYSESGRLSIRSNS